MFMRNMMAHGSRRPRLDNGVMNIDAPTRLLGGLSPAQFMRRHWQKKPLLVRRALPGMKPLLSRAALFALAAREDVESRLVVQDGARWLLRHGPLPRRALPPLKQPGWTLLVQGLDLHLRAAHELMLPFRFVPDARLDDLMLSYATDGGGVGPHLDSYDVFLLQLQGTRRWRIGPVKAPRWKPDVPLKLLAGFEPSQDWLLEPGDLLYLPPGWGHDGIAEGECMTGSIGLRAPRSNGLAHELLQRLSDAADEQRGDPIYRDAAQPATASPACIPGPMSAFARHALQRVLADRRACDRALGELLSEPKPQVWFEPGAGLSTGQGVRLDRRTRMLYDRSRLFINGESFDTSGRDARLMRGLADTRMLGSRQVQALSTEAGALLSEWATAGWLHPQPD
jgi:50S ribosomal protein L16 3-hydroxylase